MAARDPARHAGAARRSAQVFRVQNRIVNPVVRVILRSPLGGRLGRAVALLAYRGAVSGREVTLPVQYAVDTEGRYVVVPGRHEQKTWWRNFRQARHVRLHVAGRDVAGDAVLLDDAHEIEGALATYVRRFPAAARAAHVRLLPDGTPVADDLANTARAGVVLRVTPSQRSAP